MRHFTREGVHPFDVIMWEFRTALVSSEKGGTIFEQEGVEVPSFWSQQAATIMASKYLRGKLGSPTREYSARQLVARVASTIAAWGRKGNYFKSEIDAQSFEDELTHILINQYAAFNSPVWLNVGVHDHPQCSACFINSVTDELRSVLNLTVTEGMLFKYGSGSGVNLSPIRSSRETLRDSSELSPGPLAFMRGLDAFAGAIKSGGTVRKSAKMVILNGDHPDILEFITCKVVEEKKAWALIDAGYDPSFNGEAYQSVFFQNANNSVRLTDEFMRAYEHKAPWNLRAVTTGETVATLPASEVMEAIAKASWECGDPGVQYDTTINHWNPCAVSGRIHASNPCSEYLFLNDTSCNLASINVLKFFASGVFDLKSYEQVIDVMIMAQEIIVDNASYPTPTIEKNSYAFRPLGLGFANIGALIMAAGCAYDSDEGRGIAAGLAAVLSGRAYLQSARIAGELGAFTRFAENRDTFLRVIDHHRTAANTLKAGSVMSELVTHARTLWDEAYMLGSRVGFRNAQISVIAPTGTIAFLMDCDTTGIEPDIALVKYKWLVGGGMMKMVNTTIASALATLGYRGEEIVAIAAYIAEHDMIEGAPYLKDEHLAVFDCALKPANGARSITPLGHLKMMAVVQPFISGAISKTVNVQHSATVQDIIDVYVEGWKLGLKAIAVYRDGCKRVQALTTSAKQTPEPVAVVIPDTTQRRRRLSDERKSITHKFQVGAHEGYLTIGLYDDGAPGEIFVRMSKEGSVISGLMDSFATAVSIGLQYGVPLKVLVNKFAHTRFEPSGITHNPHIRFAKSLVDYIFRYLASKFLSLDDQYSLGIHTDEEQPAESAPVQSATLFSVPPQTFDTTADAPACNTCGSIMIRYAACYRCINCGSTTGCS